MARRNYGKYDWQSPGKRSRMYANDIKNKQHTGEKSVKYGKELNSEERAFRQGYLASQKDNNGVFKYKDAIRKGYSKKEAGTISRQPYNKKLPKKKV